MGNRRATPPPGSVTFPRDAWALKALEQAGLVTAATVEALGRDAPTWIATAAVAAGADPDAVAAALARAAHVGVANLARIDQSAAHFVPEQVARQYVALPLSATDRLIRIATANPMDLHAEQALGFVAGRQIEFLYALPAELQARIENGYRPERTLERMIGGLESGGTLGAAGEGRGGVAPAGTETPAYRLVEATIADAAAERASQILFEPLDQGLAVRYRVDGVLREVLRVPPSAAGSVVRRLKVLAQLDIADPVHPHEGRATATVAGRVWDLRVSTAPVPRAGEKVTVRLVDAGAGVPPLGALGFLPDEQAAIERLLGHRDGVVVVTGPLGSGNIGTLYAALQRARSAGAGVVTVEDVVEHRLAGVVQLTVDPAHKSPFAAALKVALKESADFVLLGEMRDTETADLAWQAALQGRLVVTAMRTRDSAAAVAHLGSLGIDPRRVASTLRGVVAQRLVRRLCPHCAVPAAPDSLPSAVRIASRIAQPPTLRVGRGCGQCGFTGFRGLMAVAEVLAVEGEVAELIGRNAPFRQVVDAMRRAGSWTLFDAALRRVWDGSTTYEEVVRVVGDQAPHAGEPETPTGPVVMSVASRLAEEARGAAVDRTPVEEAPPLVLIADDDPQMRQLVRTILEAEGMRVAEAVDGIAALDEAQRQRPTVVLLDMDMPRLDGLGVLETLRKRLLGRAVPVIVVTVHDDPAIETRCIELGAEDYITKPIQPASLVARIRAVLRRAGTR